MWMALPWARAHRYARGMISSIAAPRVAAASAAAPPPLSLADLPSAADEAARLEGEARRIEAGIDSKQGQRRSMLRAIEQFSAFPGHAQDVRDSLLDTDWGNSIADPIRAVTMQVQAGSAAGALEYGNSSFARSFDSPPALVGTLKGHADAINELESDMDGFGSRHFPHREEFIGRALDTFKAAGKDAAAAVALLQDELAKPAPE